MSVDGEEDNTVYCPDYFGTSDIADLNIPEEAFSDGYVGLMRIRDEKYYHVTRIIKGQHDDYFLMSLVPMETVYKGRSLVALSTFIVMLLAILVLLGRILICNKEEYDGICREAKDDMEFRKSLTSVQLDKLDSELRKKPTSSQRILNVIKKIWVGLLFLCTSQFENLSAYLLSFAWQRGVNIFFSHHDAAHYFQFLLLPSSAEETYVCPGKSSQCECGDFLSASGIAATLCSVHYHRFCQSVYARR